MKADIKLDNDSVEIEGDLKLQKIVSKDLLVAGASVEIEGALKLQRIVSKGLRVVGSLTMVGVGETPANGFMHLVLKPDSLVRETIHAGGIKRFDIIKEIGQNTSDIKKVASETKQAATDAKQAGTEAKEATKLGTQVAADVKKVAADLTQVRGEVKSFQGKTNWTVVELRSSMGITVGSLVESVAANTPVQQVVITGNKIVVRTVKHQGTTGTPGSFLGVQIGPLETIDEFDLVADNQNLKKQVIGLQRQVAALEKRVGVLESKVK
jgi:hypothetical protein